MPFGSISDPSEFLIDPSTRDNYLMNQILKPTLLKNMITLYSTSKKVKMCNWDKSNPSFKSAAARFLVLESMMNGHGSLEMNKAKLEEGLINFCTET